MANRQLGIIYIYSTGYHIKVDMSKLKVNKYNGTQSDIFTGKSSEHCRRKVKFKNATNGCYGASLINNHVIHYVHLWKVCIFKC